MNYSFLLILVLVPGRTLYGAIYALERLYNPHSRTTIDLVYDEHTRQQRLTRRSMQEGCLHCIEEKLHMTERTFMKVLRRINNGPEAQRVTLVWEQGLYGDADSEFIGHSIRLVKNQFKNIRYIASDKARDAYEMLIRCNRKSFHGSSREEPIPLPDQRKESIINACGKPIFSAFKRLFDGTVGKARAYFKRLKRPRAAHFDHNNCFDALADSEMLSHILSVTDGHVIVYAGGWHCENISRFLVSQASCVRIFSAHPRWSWVSKRSINRLIKPYTPKSPPPIKVGSSEDVSNQRD